MAIKETTGTPEEIEEEIAKENARAERVRRDLEIELKKQQIEIDKQTNRTLGSIDGNLESIAGSVGLISVIAVLTFLFKK